MTEHLVLKVVARMLIPLILLFGLYVQFHGDFGPGGGFQAGVIFASAFLLYGLVFGIAEVGHALSPAVVRALIALGVLIYVGTGIVSVLLGASFLDYDVLASTPLGGQHLGILIVELGVGISVFGVMMAVFYSFAGRPESR